LPAEYRFSDLAEFSTIRELQLVIMSNKQAQCGAFRGREITIATGVNVDAGAR